MKDLLKAKEKLTKAREACELVDTFGRKCGKVISLVNKNGPCAAVSLENCSLITVETLERWLKQAKAVHKKGYNQI